MISTRDTIIRFKVPEHIRRIIWDLANEEPCDFQTMVLHCILDGLKLRIVKRGHIMNSTWVEFLRKGNSGAQS